MSWANLLASGSGFANYRLMVEGWPHQWTTHPSIAADPEGTEAGFPRKVYPGLSFEGLRISERLVLRDAWPEVDGITARIVPTDSNEDTLNGFTRDARSVAELTESIDADTTTWSTRPVLTGGVFHLGTEAVVSDGEGDITRGHWNSQAQDHPTDDGVYATPVQIYNWPPTMEGRRAYLYAYGTGDDPLGEGTVIWRGVVSSPPAMDSDGLSWVIDIAPITAVFDQSVGTSDKVEYHVRGIYHSGRCPLVMKIRTRDDGVQEVPQITALGFFETEEAWAEYVNGQIATKVAAATGGASTNLHLVSYRPNAGTPYFYVAAATATDTPLEIVVWDFLDGNTLQLSPGEPAKNGSPITLTGVASISAGGVDGEFGIGAADTQPPWQYPLPPGRTLLGEIRFVARHSKYFSQWRSFYTFDPSNLWPSNRVYLNSVIGLDIGDTLLVKNGDEVRAIRINNIDTDNRWIAVDLLTEPSRGVHISSESTIVPLRIYGEDTNWSGFMAELVSQSSAANGGDTPWITNADVAMDAWPAIWSLYPIDPYWSRRTYHFVKQVRVRDVFAAELMLTGFMAHLAGDGRLNIAPMPFVSPQMSASSTLTDDEILLPTDGFSGMFPTWKAQADGLVNIAQVRLGYNVNTDEFEEDGDYTIRMVPSIAAHKSGDKASQTIEVRSQTAGQERTLNTVPPGATDMPAITAVQITDSVMPYLRCLSNDYAVVTVAVPFTKFGVLVGDIVEVTSQFIPNGLGGRGVVSKKAICVGRTWELDPAAQGMGTLSLWIPRSVGAGYAPTGRITAQSGDGDTWTITLDPANMFNLAWSESQDGNVIKHFAANEPIQIVQVDSTTPIVVVGMITDVHSDSSELDVVLDSSWTPGAYAWNLRFYYDGSTYVERQQAYGWVADSNGQLVDESSAREFE